MGLNSLNCFRNPKKYFAYEFKAAKNDFKYFGSFFNLKERTVLDLGCGMVVDYISILNLGQETCGN